MNQLTKTEAETLIELLRRAIFNNQIDIGVFIEVDEDRETYGVVTDQIEIYDFCEMDSSDDVSIGIYMGQEPFYIVEDYLIKEYINNNLEVDEVH